MFDARAKRACNLIRRHTRPRQHMDERHRRLRDRHLQYRFELLPYRIAFQNVRHDADDLPEVSRLTRRGDAHARADWLPARKEFLDKTLVHDNDPR